jgi:cytoskeletal protein CcmA (bactofilin family)
MFQKQDMAHRDAMHEPETVISASVKLEGDFVSQGNVLIEGIVEGSLRTDKNLKVGERASITADVAAQNATVAGEVRGNVTVAERLELEPTARVMGDVRTKVLVVASGATINGSVTMGAEEFSAPRSAKPAKVPKVKESATAEDLLDGAKETAEETRKTVNAFFTK